MATVAGVAFSPTAVLVWRANLVAPDAAEVGHGGGKSAEFRIQSHRIEGDSMEALVKPLQFLFVAFPTCPRAYPSFLCKDGAMIRSVTISATDPFGSVPAFPPSLDRFRIEGLMAIHAPLFLMGGKDSGCGIFSLFVLRPIIPSRTRCLGRRPVDRSIGRSSN